MQANGGRGQIEGARAATVVGIEEEHAERGETGQREEYGKGGAGEVGGEG